MSANLGRQIRLEKIYSRARDRVDLLRHVDDEYDDDFEFPLSAEPLDDEQRQSLASLMGPDETTSSISIETSNREALHQHD